MEKIKLILLNLLLNTILPAITPALKDLLGEYALAFYWKAKETSNPMDDVLATFILDILDIPIPTN